MNPALIQQLYYNEFNSWNAFKIFGLYKNTAKDVFFLQQNSRVPGCYPLHIKNWFYTWRDYNGITEKSITNSVSGLNITGTENISDTKPQSSDNVLRVWVSNIIV